MKKLEKVRELIERLGFNLNKLAEHGFKRRYTNSASGHIWINRKLGVVVKVPCIVRVIRSHPKFAIPTLEFRPPRRKWWEYCSRRIFIQPIAIRRALDKAFCRLIDWGCYSGSDFKRANIGWYRNKPVLIDW